MRTQVMVVVLSCLLCACASIQERKVMSDPLMDPGRVLAKIGTSQFFM